MYYQPIVSRVAEEVHHFASPVDHCSCPPEKNATLDDASFCAPVASQTPELRTLKSTSASVPWYSPTADCRHVPIADLELARYLESKDALDKVGDVDLVVLLKGHKDILIRDTKGWHGSGEWLLPITLLGSHCAIAWRVELKDFAGTNKRYFDLCEDTKEHLVFLTHPNEWQVQVFEWWSPLHQRVSCPDAPESKSNQARCRGVLVGDQLELLKHVASKAFGQLPKTTLLRVAGALHIDVSKDDELLDILIAMITELTGSNDELDVMHMIKHRVVPKDNSEFFQNLLECDDVLDIMDRDDKEDAQKDVAAGNLKEEERKSFKEVWKQKKRAVKAAVKKKGKVLDPAKQLARNWKGLKEFPADVPAQAQMKCMTPPGGYIWRANTQRAWAEHFKPYPRISASWLEFGPSESARRVLEQLWRHYPDNEDLPIEACPVKGVFKAPLPGAASSSSSSKD